MIYEMNHHQFSKSERIQRPQLWWPITHSNELKLKNQHQLLNITFTTMSASWIFIASLKGLWPPSLCWGCVSVWGIHFLLSSFHFLLVPGQRSFMSLYKSMILPQQRISFQHSSLFAVTSFKPIEYFYTMLHFLTHWSMSLLSAAESLDHRSTRHNTAPRRERSKVVLHERSFVCTGMSTFWWMWTMHWT